MQYTLITSQGQIQQFFVLAVAQLYKQIYGGVVVTNEVLETVEEVALVDECIALT